MNTQLKIEQMQSTLKEVGERIDELVSGGVEFGPDAERELARRALLSACAEVSCEECRDLCDALDSARPGR